MSIFYNSKSVCVIFYCLYLCFTGLPADDFRMSFVCTIYLFIIYHYRNNAKEFNEKDFMNKDKTIETASQPNNQSRNYMDYKPLSIYEVEKYLGLGHTKVQGILNRGELQSFWIDTRRFVSSIDIVNYICKLRERGQIGPA